MKTLNKAYKIRLYPNEDQKQFFEQNFGNARFIYNKMLADKINFYKETGEMLKNSPAQYKKEFDFLKLSDSLALANAQQNLNRAYSNFFRNPGKTGFPKFKSKHKSKPVYQTNNQISKNGKHSIFIENNKINLPKIGLVKVKGLRTFKKNSVIKTVTISRTPTNKYFASILVEYQEKIKSVKRVTEDKIVGLDYSMSNLYFSSDGVVASNPQYYRNTQPKLAKEQRKLSKMKKGSQNYKKQKLKVSKVHEKIANQRKDFLHKESREIANLYDLVCVEDLNMKSMSQALNFGKSVHDNGWGMFVNMLEYKLLEQGKHFVKADKWFASSKTCSNCGNKKDELKLTERVYRCDNCSAVINRDINAAINLKQYAIKSLKV